MSEVRIAIASVSFRKAAIAMAIEPMTRSQTPSQTPSQTRSPGTPSPAALSDADDALARFDERLRTSPIRDGVMARLDFADACAGLWLAGDLVTPEDLVLHDAERDLRMPTHALTQAHTMLRTRRYIARQPPHWALSPPGLWYLRGFAERGGEAATPARAPTEPADVASRAQPPAPLIFDPDWDEDARLTAWQETLAANQHQPPVLAAALAWDAWETNAAAATPPLARSVAGRHPICARAAKPDRICPVCTSGCASSNAPSAGRAIRRARLLALRASLRRRRDRRPQATRPPDAGARGPGPSCQRPPQHLASAGADRSRHRAPAGEHDPDCR